jgi:hypothetical protein
MEKMDRKLEEQVKSRVKNGWIRVGMMIEAMAISRETASSALKKHVEKMEKEKGVLVYKKECKGVEEVKKPLPNIEKGYCEIFDVEMIVENFDRLVYIVLNYGPSAIEILEPHNITMNLGEAQGILNSLAMLVHTFAAMGAGGMIVST